MQSDLPKEANREQSVIYGQPPASGFSIAQGIWALLGLILFIPYLIAAALLNCPGIDFRFTALRILVRSGLRKGSLSARKLYGLLIYPMDSVRYFEFDFVLQAIKGAEVTHFLDVSSPRLLPVSILLRYPEATGHLINPDEKDLSETRQLIDSQKLSSRSTLDACLIQTWSSADAMDLITSISVVEHIPDDTAAIRAMWKALKPGGRLVLTMPCRPQPMDEYADFNQYRLLEANAEGLVFWQRFYSMQCLEKRIFTVTGPPAKMVVYGEKKQGLYFKNVKDKMSTWAYPYWREPYFMARYWKVFSEIDALPGVGVVGLLFIKPH